jgi:hypothetical protein
MTPGQIAVSFALISVGLLLTGCTLDSADTVGPDQSAPALGVSTDTVDYGLTGFDADLIIYNTGGGLLTWTFSDFPVWIEPSSAEGSLGVSASDTVSLVCIRTALAVGSNTGEIALTSNGGDLALTVLADLSSDPLLGDLPDTITFGTFTDSLLLTIANAGQGILNWTLDVSESWLSASAYAGSTVTQEDIWIILDRESAPWGETEAYVGINSNGGSGQITVTAFIASTVSQWLSYCGDPDYYYYAQPKDYFYIVRFDRPPGWDSFRISKVRVNLHTLIGAYDPIQMLCWSVVESQGGFWPNMENGLLYQTSTLNPILGWNTWTVDWPLSLDLFCVGYYQYDYIPTIFPRPYYDLSAPAARSYIMYEDYYGIFYIDYLPDKEWCLEVFVEPIEALAGTTQSEGQWLKSRTAALDAATQFTSAGQFRPISINRGDHSGPVRR